MSSASGTNSTSGNAPDFFAWQETGGDFPDEDRIHSGWTDGDTANVCIGQGGSCGHARPDGGDGFLSDWQRRKESPVAAAGGPDRTARRASSGEVVTNFPSGMVRDKLDVHPRNLQILRDAMLADVQSSEGNGHNRRGGGSENLRQDRHGGSPGCSQQLMTPSARIFEVWRPYAPYEHPKYAVRSRDGRRRPARFRRFGLRADLAHDIYEAILKEQKPQPRQRP